MNTNKYIASLLLIILIFTSSFGQEKSKIAVDFGADLASRYVWRGLEFSDSPAIQPYLEFNYKNLSLGAWASYETGGQVVGQEFDIYASYSLGAISISFTDYSFPVDGATDNYFQMKTHIGEIMIGYDNTDKFPLTVSVGANIYNDDQHSIYTEIGYPFNIKNIDLNLFVGAGNEQYTTDQDFDITNFGISASKEVTITEKFSVNTTASIIFNPDTSDAYFVFMLSL
ncbi:MAG: hypothetical protein COB81_08140 [Flavobacteriaceae bacterium]|nr:MAG: hypothetical protein COB81_08140 [Flavobacteriaceae bacterium]